MQDEKWKKYKKRFPPTFEFFKHGLSRLSEIAYRIGLLALFWTVCGGLPFGIMMGIEVLFISVTGFMFMKMDGQLNADGVLLYLNTLILIPSEQVWADQDKWTWAFTLADPELSWSSFFLLCIAAAVNCCCCCGLASLLTAISTIVARRDCETKTSLMPTMRIGMSLMELIVLIFYGLFAEHGKRAQFLTSPDHGLVVFIATCVFFVTYTQYMWLFPDFSLPGKVSVRSKWGYAYSNELSELKKIRVRPVAKRWERKILQQCDDPDGPDEEAKRFMAKVQTQIVSDAGFVESAKAENAAFNLQNTYMVGNTTFFLYDRRLRETLIYKSPSQEQIRADFWDETHNGEPHGLSAAMFALAKEYTDIVEWLEEQGATFHIDKNITVRKAKWSVEQITEGD